MSEVYDEILRGTEMLDKKIQQLEKERNRFLTIAYNAICLGQLDERFSKDELLRELGCNEEEFAEIMER